MIFILIVERKLANIYVCVNNNTLKTITIKGFDG